MNERQVRRSGEDPPIESKMVFPVRDHNKIAFGTRWFAKRAAFTYRFGVGMESSAVKTWLISQVIQRAADVNMPLRSRRFGHRISERPRYGERAIE